MKELERVKSGILSQLHFYFGHRFLSSDLLVLLFLKVILTAQHIATMMYGAVG